MKANYQPWQITPQEFPFSGNKAAQLRFLVGFAVLAPSAHNTQPWFFKLRKNTLELYADHSRALSVSDADHRQLFLSLGACLENLLVASTYFGFPTKVRYFPDKKKKNLVARISLASRLKPQTDQPDHLIFSLLKRSTNHNQYDPHQRIPPKLLQKIKAAGLPGIRIDVVTELKKREILAETITFAMDEAMADSQFRQELSHWIKPNITGSKVGMPCFCLEIPTLPSLLAPFLMRHFNLNKLTRQQDLKILRRFTPAFVLISTQKDRPLDQLKAGQIYERIALEATKVDFDTHVRAAPIQVKNYYQKLQKIFGLNFRPQILFRLGKTLKKQKLCPRLSAAEVIKK